MTSSQRFVEVCQPFVDGAAHATMRVVAIDVLGEAAAKVEAQQLLADQIAGWTITAILPALIMSLRTNITLYNRKIAHHAALEARRLQEHTEPWRAVTAPRVQRDTTRVVPRIVNLCFGNSPPPGWIGWKLVLWALFFLC